MELIVVIGIFALLSIFLLGVFVANNRFYANQSGEIRAISGTRLIADRIAEYGRGAVSVVANYTYDGVDYVSDADTAIWQIPSVDAAWDIITGSYDYVIITKDASDPLKLFLYLAPAGGSARGARDVLLTDRLQSVEFDYLPASPPSTERVDYAIIINIGGTSPAAERVEGSVTLRNK